MSRPPDRTTIPHGLADSEAGLLPQRRHHVAWVGGAGRDGSSSTDSARVLRRFCRGGGAASGTTRRPRRQRTGALGRRIRNGRRSRHDGALRVNVGSAGNVQWPTDGAFQRGRRIRARCGSLTATSCLETTDGVPLAKTHFGYTDGITATPRILGGPEPVAPDHQEPCEPWLFILSDDADSYHLPSPPELWHNGSFGVFKMMEQDVVGFETFLQSKKDQIDPELLAAKICGRWRNGVPLVLSPDTDSPAGGMTAEQFERLRVCQQRRFW